MLRKKLLLHVWYTGATTENRKATQQVINTVPQNNWLFTATPGDHQQILLSQKNHCYHRSSLPCLPPVWPVAPGWRLTNSVFPKTIQTVNSITPHTQATHIQPLNSNQVQCVLCYCLFVCFFVNSAWLYIFRVFYKKNLFCCLTIYIWFLHSWHWASNILLCIYSNIKGLVYAILFISSSIYFQYCCITNIS